MFLTQNSSGLASPDMQQSDGDDSENRPVNAADAVLDNQQTHDDTTSTQMGGNLCAVYGCPLEADSGWSLAATNNVVKVRQYRRQCRPLIKYELCNLHYHQFNTLQCEPQESEPTRAVALSCDACDARNEIYSRSFCVTHQIPTKNGGSVTLPCHLLHTLPLYDQAIQQNPSGHLTFCGTCKDDCRDVLQEDEPSCKLCSSPKRFKCQQVRGTPLSLSDYVCSYHRSLLSHGRKRNTCSCWDCGRQPVKTKTKLLRSHLLTLAELRLLSQAPEPLLLQYGAVFRSTCFAKHAALAQGSPVATVADGDVEEPMHNSPTAPAQPDEVPFTTPGSGEAAATRRHTRRKLAYAPAPPPLPHLNSSPLPQMMVDSPAFSEPTSTQTTNELEDIPTEPKRKQQRRATQHATDLASLNSIISRLADYVGQPPLHAKHRLQKEFDGRAPATQRRFLALFNHVVDCAAMAINPASPDQLKAAAARMGQPRETLCEFARRRMDDLVEMHAMADEQKLKRTILAIACVKQPDGSWEHTKTELALKFQVTPHQVAEARRTRRLNDLGKYFSNQTIVQNFINWGFECCQFSLQPYGVMCLKMEDGQKLTMGRVVQSGISGHVIDAYIESKQGTDFTPLSKRALYRILNEVLKLKPTRALSGLDYYAVQGQEALSTMEALLQQHVKCKDEKKLISTGVAKIRRYLTTKYTSKVTAQSSCSTHCPSYSLNHPTKPELKNACEHEHTDCCPDCALIRSTTSALHDCLAGIVDGKERERALWSYSEALNDLLDWQRHQLRCSQQRKGRLELVNGLKTDEGFLIVDYGNKILPRKFQESVREYFGKKGMTVLTFALILPGAPNTEVLNRRTYTVFQQESDQLVTDVMGLYDLVLGRIHRDHPNLRTLHEKSDNASNFKNGLLLSCRPVIAAKHNIKVETVLFCEPGDGKDMPDAHFGQLRQLLDARLNAGHNQTTVEQVYDVLKQSPVKIKGANYVVATITQRKCQKSDSAAVGIKAYHHFRYEDGGRIRGWHHFGIGAGELLSLKVSGRPVQDMLPKVTVKPDYDFVDGIVPSVSSLRVRSTAAADYEVVRPTSAKIQSSFAVRQLFVDHVMTSVDREERDNGTPPLEAVASERCDTPMGWAKPPKVARARFTPRQLAMMDRIYEANKVDANTAMSPDEAVQHMQQELSSAEWLRSKQIKAYWSRRKGSAVKAKISKEVEPAEIPDPSPDDEEEEEYAEAQQAVMQQLVGALPPASDILFAGSVGDYIVFASHSDTALRAGRICELLDDRVNVDLYTRLADSEVFRLKQRVDEEVATVKHDAIRELLTAVDEDEAETTATFDKAADWLPLLIDDAASTVDAHE